MPNANRYLKDCIRLRTMTSGSYIISKTLQTGMIPTLTMTRSQVRTLQVQVKIVPKVIQVMKNLSYPRKLNRHRKCKIYRVGQLTVSNSGYPAKAFLKGGGPTFSQNMLGGGEVS